MLNERYYYSVMDIERKKVYRSIFDGIVAHESKIIIDTELKRDDITNVYFTVLLDNPTFYYVNQRTVSTIGRGRRITVIPEYLFSVPETERISRDIKSVIKKVKTEGEKYRDNPFRLERFLHDTVVKSVAYNYDALNHDDCYNAHSIVGAFLEDTAVCEGISKAYKLLCNEFDIKCIVVRGITKDSGVFSEDNRHAWNLVKIRNESYYVDVTWDRDDINNNRYINYDYFNITTKDILKDHVPKGTLPVCSSTGLNYFYASNSFVSTYAELKKLISDRYDAKTIMFKARSDRGEFRSIKEFREKSMKAYTDVSRFKLNKRTGYHVFNDEHMIGKIYFND